MSFWSAAFLSPLLAWSLLSVLGLVPQSDTGTGSLELVVSLGFADPSGARSDGRFRNCDEALNRARNKPLVFTKLVARTFGAERFAQDLIPVGFYPLNRSSEQGLERTDRFRPRGGLSSAQAAVQK